MSSSSRTQGAASEPNDPLFRVQPAALQWRLADLHQIATGRGVRVAVIDSKVEVNHPDLKGQVQISQDFVDGRTVPTEAVGVGRGAGKVERVDPHALIQGREFVGAGRGLFKGRRTRLVGAGALAATLAVWVPLLVVRNVNVRASLFCLAFLIADVSLVVWAGRSVEVGITFVVFFVPLGIFAALFLEIRTVLWVQGATSLAVNPSVQPTPTSWAVLWDLANKGKVADWSWPWACGGCTAPKYSTF